MRARIGSQRNRNSDRAREVNRWFFACDDSRSRETAAATALTQRTTFAFGADEQKAAVVPAGEACGPAVAEHGREFFKVADLPGWQEYDIPELRK